MVGEHGLAGQQRVPEQGLQIAELHARVHLLGEHTPGRLVPGDVGDRMRLEVRLPLRVVQHLAHEAVSAVRHRQEGLEQPFEGLPLVVGFDVGGLRLPHSVQHPVLPVERLRGLAGLGHIVDIAVPQHRTIRLRLRQAFRTAPARALARMADPEHRAPGFQLVRGRPDGVRQGLLVVCMHPAEQDSSTLVQLLGRQVEQIAHHVADELEAAPALDGHARLEHHARHPGRDVLQQLQLLHMGVDGLALGRDVLHHTKVGLWDALDGGLADAGAHPAHRAIRPCPTEIQLAPVARRTGLQPRRHVLGMDAAAPHGALQRVCRRKTGDLEQPR